MTNASAPARVELSGDKIIDAALELIDAHGLGALNMRRLGVAVGASTMSVYRHFRDKSDLLDAVVDHIVEDFAPPPGAGGWREQARAMCLRVRGAMLAHPELAELIGRELRRSPASLRVNTAIIARLKSAGVPMALLPDTYWALSSYTTGYTLLEAQTHRHQVDRARRTSGPERVGKLARLLERVDGISRQAAGDAAVVLARPLDETQFLFGLECLIRGLADRFESACAQAPHAEA
jgi:AcrR family transcriptional regulator